MNTKEFTIALMKNGNIKGWFVADDVKLSPISTEAAKFSSLAKAKAEADIINSQWYLYEGEIFTAQEVKA